MVGGSGAGVQINPIAFLVIQKESVKLLPINHNSSIDKLLDYVPDILEKANCAINKCIQNKQKKKEIEIEIEKPSKPKVYKSEVSDV